MSTKIDQRERAILHLDMDAFFAAVEVLDAPALRGLPVIVGGTPEGHGVVSTASYEARRFGVRSAMPAAQAVRLCPQGVYLRPRMGRYADVSRRVFELLRAVTPLVEPLSIDEAFLDVTGCSPASGRVPGLGPGDLGQALQVARELQERVETSTGGLTCSVGVAENKFLAKLASDLRKPRGLVLVPRGEAPEFLAPLPVERIWGVGPRSAEKLRALGLDTIGKIAALPCNNLEKALGIEWGRHVHRLAHGLDDREVVTDNEARSVSQETTFARFIPAGDAAAVEQALFELSEGVAIRARHEGVWGRTVRLKARDDQFVTVTRAHTLPAPTQNVEEIYPTVLRLFRERVKFGRRSVRLLGVGLSSLTTEPVRQLDLFDEAPRARQNARDLADLTDTIRERLGDDAILRGRQLRGPARPPPQRAPGEPRPPATGPRSARGKREG